MASRINVKVVVIVVLVVGFLALGIGGVAYWRFSKSADRNIARGDLYMESGQPRDAYKSYGRAVRKKPGDMATLDKYQQALLQVVPIGRDDARELYTAKIGILKNRSTYDRLDPENHLALIREIRYAASLMPRDQLWEEIQIAADQMWADLPESEPKRIDARLYRAMSIFQRAFVLTGQDIEEAEADIVAYLEANPESDLGWSTRISGALARLERANSEGMDTKTRELEDELRAIVNEARRSSEGPYTARAIALYEAVRRVQSPDEVGDEELRAALDLMIERVGSSEDPLLVLQVSQFLGNLSWMGYGDQAIELLENLLERQPSALWHRMLLVDLLYQTGKLDDAIEQARLVIDAPMLPASVESQFQDQLQRQARALLVDTAHRRWEQADQDERPERLAAVEAAVEDLRSVSIDPDNDFLLIRAEGKLAIGRGDFQAAAARFNRLAGNESRRAEDLLYAARALEETGEVGVAYERLGQLQAVRPSSSAILHECSRLAFKLRRWEEAKAWNDALLDQDPGHLAGSELRILIEAERAGEKREPLTRFAQAIEDAERAMIDGDVETARSTLEAELKDAPKNVRLLAAALQVEINAANTEAARGYVDRMLEVEPDAPLLLQLRAALSSDDPIVAIDRYLESTETDPGERAVSRVINLATLAERYRGATDRAEERGDTDAAARAREIAERAETELGPAIAQAEALAPDHRQFLEYKLRKAVREEDWDAADQVVQRARQTDADLARGLIFEGQLALVRGRPEEAARLLSAATERVPHSSIAWKALAAAYAEIGNFGEARGAYEEAYRNNPNDVDTVRRYVTLLNQMGERTRALRIMRQARRLLPNDSRVREVWLQLEADAGDRSLVYRERAMIYTVDPDDRTNAMALATFLAVTEPIRELLLDTRGAPIFSEFQWARMNADRQEKLLADQRAVWLEESQKILDELAETTPDDLGVAVLRARLLRERGGAGAVEDGERSLREFVQQHQAGGDPVRLNIALAQYQSAVGRTDRAVATLEAIRDRQDAETRDVDVALADLHFQNLDYTKAAEAYSRAGETNDSEKLHLRVIECYTKLGDFDAARAKLDQWMDDGHDGYFVQMLSATLADGEGDRLMAEGSEAEAQQRFAARDVALDEAERLSPSNPYPHIQRAESLLRAFGRAFAAASGEEVEDLRRRSDELDEALVALDRADEVRAGEPRTSLTRAVVLQARGDDRGAIGELQRLLERAPDEIIARQRLAQLQNANGDFAGALATIETGRSRQPLLPMWPEFAGDLQLNQLVQRRQDALARGRTLDPAEAKELSEKAAGFYRAAVALEPTPPIMSKLVSSLLNADRMDEAVRVLEEHREIVEANFVLGSMYAVALNAAGRVADAETALADAWGRRGDAPTDQWRNAVETIFIERRPAELEAFVRRVTGDPLDPMIATWVAGTWARRGPEGRSRALELQRSAVNADRGSDPSVSAALQFGLAALLIANGQYDDALIPLRRTIEHDPQHLQALNDYAYLKATHRGEPQEALPFALQAAELLATARASPMLQSSVLDTVGWIYWQTGDAENAESTLRRSVTARETPSNCLHLAVVLAAPGPGQDLRVAEEYILRASQFRSDPQTQREIADAHADIRTKAGRGQ